MKKFILRFLVFIGFSIFTYLILLFIWNSIKPGNLESNLNYRIAAGGHLFSRLREVETSNTVDVVVLGSSHAYRSFDPRIFKEYNYSLFNLGSSAQTPIQSEILLTKYIDKLKPKIVILEVFPNSIISDGVEASLDLISNTTKNDASTLQLFIDSKNIKILNTFIIAKLIELFNLNSSLKEPALKGDDIYISGGYVENSSIIFGKCENINLEPIVNPMQIKAIGRIEQMLKKREIPLLYVTAPVPKLYFQNHPGYEIFYKQFKSKANYLDYSQFEPMVDSLHFKDCDHLNQFGTEVFNHEFLSKFKISN